MTSSLSTISNHETAKSGAATGVLLALVLELAWPLPLQSDGLLVDRGWLGGGPLAGRLTRR